ncbi:polysaccharide deacetylase family protein, partial [Chlamydiota bacterium]
LVYHGVTRKNERKGIEDYQNNHIDKKKFYEQVQYLAENYNVITGDELIDSIKAKKSLPDYSLLITIDDGYKNNHTTAYPILRCFNLPAIVFIPTAFINNKKALWSDKIIYSLSRTKQNMISFNVNSKTKCFDISNSKKKMLADRQIRQIILLKDLEERYRIINSIIDETNIDLDEDIERYEDYSSISWNELRKISEHNIYIGAHTHNHVCLSALTKKRITEELKTANRELLDNLGYESKIFAYPYGGLNSFDKKSKALLKDFGYVCSFINVAGFNDFSKEYDLFELKRISIENDMDFITFKARITGFYQYISAIKQQLVNLWKRYL